MHLLASFAVLTVATHWLLSVSAWKAHLAGPSLVLACCSSRYLLMLAVFILLIAALARESMWASLKIQPLVWRAARALLLAITVLFVIATTRASYRQLAVERLALNAWGSLGAWVQGHTPATSLFLLPYAEPLIGVNPSGHDAPLNTVENSFEAVALRRGWVDSKRGAAVMWASSYYDVWTRRMSELKDLKSLTQEVDYARQHGIDYVVTSCDKSFDGAAVPIYRNNMACLYNARP